MILNLTFHGIGDPPHDVSTNERDVWLGHGEFEALLPSVAARPDVALSFDDGNASDLELALDALQRHRVRATFFVVAGRIGERGFLSEEGIRELVQAGMQVGYHGLEHRPWRGLRPGELRDEMAGRMILEAIIGRRVTTAACPFGSYDRRVLRALREAGFERVLTSDGGWGEATQWLQPRNTLRVGTSAAAAEGLLSRRRGQPWGRRLKLMAKRWR